MNPDLFPRPARKPPRVLMHVVDAGEGGGSRVWVQVRCKKCGDRGEYIVDNVTEAKRGIPCPRCNAKRSS